MYLSIFGTGNYAEWLLYFDLRDNCFIKFFCDNNKEKQGKTIKGYPICSPEALIKEKVDVVLIAIDVAAGINVKKQLISMGVCENNIVLVDRNKSEYFYSQIDEYFVIPKKQIHILERSVLEQNKMIRDLLEAVGRVELRQTVKCKDINEAEYKVYSQNREDGMIQFLVNNIKISKKIFVEFGVENYLEANTRFLLFNNNWSGLVMDGSRENIEYIKKDELYWRYNLKAEQAFITAENINDIIRNNGIVGKIGLLSIDIDGNDYWVWKAITVIDPDIVICEYNPRFGKDKAVTIPYDAEWTRFKVHYSGIYYGASIKALTLLGNEKGYSLVASDSHGTNLFFVKKTLLNDQIKEKTVEEAYVKNQYRDSRDSAGNLDFLDFEETQKILATLPIVEV